MVQFQQWVLEQPVLLGHRPKSEGDENRWGTTKSCNANKVTRLCQVGSIHRMYTEIET